MTYDVYIYITFELCILYAYISITHAHMEHVWYTDILISYSSVFRQSAIDFHRAVALMQLQLRTRDLSSWWWWWMGNQWCMKLPLLAVCIDVVESSFVILFKRFQLLFWDFDLPVASITRTGNNAHAILPRHSRHSLGNKSRLQLLQSCALSYHHGQG